MEAKKGWRAGWLAGGRPPGEWGQKGLACWLAGRPSARRMEATPQFDIVSHTTYFTNFELSLAPEESYASWLAGRPSARRMEAKRAVVLAGWPAVRPENGGKKADVLAGWLAVRPENGGNPQFDILSHTT